MSTAARMMIVGLRKMTISRCLSGDACSPSASAESNGGGDDGNAKKIYKNGRRYRTEVERQLDRRRYNPRDQFGTLSRDSPTLQTERLKAGFENPWLQGVDILERERLIAQQQLELAMDKFADAPKVLLPYRAQRKMEKQKRKEHDQYSKNIK